MGRGLGPNKVNNNRQKVVLSGGRKCCGEAEQDLETESKRWIEAEGIWRVPRTVRDRQPEIRQKKGREKRWGTARRWTDGRKDRVVEPEKGSAS